LSHLLPTFSWQLVYHLFLLFLPAEVGGYSGAPAKVDIKIRINHPGEVHRSAFAIFSFEDVFSVIPPFRQSAHHAAESLVDRH